MKRISIWLCLSVLLSVGVCSCSLHAGMPVDPSTIDFVLFEDPDSDFSTMDVRDIDGEIVRFDAAKEQMIWMADSQALDGFDVEGNRLRGGFFVIRFGTEDGQRQA